MSALRFDDVTVRYGSRHRGMTAVDRVSLVVPSGEVVGLVGESGSGKSTLARAAVGLTPLTSGQITIDGQARAARGRRRPVQMIFQDPMSSLDPRMSIGQTIAETVGGQRRLRSAACHREVERLLELVELDPARALDLPGQLSGGQRQRVALARALGAQPEVIIADEITSALDVSVQGTVLNLVRGVQHELGMSMLFISHNLAVVRYVATSIAVMYMGRIVEHGPTEQVLSDPQHPYTRDLLDAVPDAENAGIARSGSEDTVLAPVVDAEPADPRRPPSGCIYHPRCPIGPLVHAERAACITLEPDTEHRHMAACHFAAEASVIAAPTR